MPNKIAVLTIALVALVAVVGAMAYLGLSQAPTQEQQEQGGQGMREEQPAATVPLPEPTISEIDTSDWKVYFNDKYRFQVKYPSDWEIKESDKSDRSIGLVAPSDKFSAFSITELENPERLTLDEWYEKSTVIQGRPTIFFANGKLINLNGDKAYRVDSELEPPELMFVVFTASPQRHILILRAWAETKDDIIILEKILSTFRFIREE